MEAPQSSAVLRVRLNEQRIKSALASASLCFLTHVVVLDRAGFRYVSLTSSAPNSDRRPIVKH